MTRLSHLASHGLVAVAIAAGALGMSAAARADTFLETFDAPFPAWQSGWFGTMSDATNYCATNYCYVDGFSYIGPTVQGATTGLWLGNLNGNPYSPDQVTFDSAFGASLTSLKIDIASYVDSSLMAWDSNGNLIFDQTLAVHNYHDLPATRYQTFTITSTQGISSFMVNGMTLGNVVIDNLEAVTGVSPVPEPASAALMLLGLVAVGAGLRARRRRA